jgi:hypothetical protein
MLGQVHLVSGQVDHAGQMARKPTSFGHGGEDGDGGIELGSPTSIPVEGRKRERHWTSWTSCPCSGRHKTAATVGGHGGLGFGRSQGRGRGHVRGGRRKRERERARETAARHPYHLAQDISGDVHLLAQINGRRGTRQQLASSMKKTKNILSKGLQHPTFYNPV